MFVISLQVVHFITLFINRPSTCCFLSNQVWYFFKFYQLAKMENFIQSDCFRRYTTVIVVPCLTIDHNLVIDISGVVCKNKKKKNNCQYCQVSRISKNYCHHWINHTLQNFIKIGRFAVFGLKLWPKRWQVPISTGVNIDRRQESQKNLSPLNSGPSIYVDFQVSSKLRRMQLLLKTIVTIEFTTLHNYGLEDHRCQYW